MWIKSIILRNSIVLNKGFLLLERLFSLLISSILIASILSFYPKIHHHISNFIDESKLDNAINSVIDKITKEIQRAGFIAPNRFNNNSFGLKISNDGHCIILHYDENKLVRLRLIESHNQNSDLFAYRHANNNVEYKRNTNHCNGTGWIKLLDEKIYSITQFKLIKISNQTHDEHPTNK